MRALNALSVLLLGHTLVHATSLEVYQDTARYHYTPHEHFIGFTQGVEARCEGTIIPLVEQFKCPPQERLCHLHEGIEETQQQIQGVVSTAKVLKELTALPKPTKINAALWIEAAKQIGEAQSDLIYRKKRLGQSLHKQQKQFQRQAPTDEIVGVETPCNGEMTLTIPYGYLSFETRYEGVIAKDKNIEVTQYLSVTNRSGIDMVVDTAKFYYRAAHQPIYPRHFSPWIVRKYSSDPQSFLKAKRALASDQRVAMPMMEKSRAMLAPALPAPRVSYEDAREYKVENLRLPSTGLAVELPIVSWKSPLTCELRSYPYERKEVFEVCSFLPKYQIETHQWKVKSDKGVISERASGEYRDGKYQIYTQRDDDIDVARKPIVQKERESGIFGGTARKKDGFTVTLTNKSDKEKKITVIDRIPTSVTEEISVKLLSVKSSQNVSYKLLKEGKLQITVLLKAKMRTTIDVVFEMSYDKKLRVEY